MSFTSLKYILLRQLQGWPRIKCEVHLEDKGTLDGDYGVDDGDYCKDNTFLQYLQVDNRHFPNKMSAVC